MNQHNTPHLPSHSTFPSLVPAALPSACAAHHRARSRRCLPEDACALHLHRLSDRGYQWSHRHCWHGQGSHESGRAQASAARYVDVGAAPFGPVSAASGHGIVRIVSDEKAADAICSPVS
mmetsp:Transcript_41953/g.84190  ORF Transcript_41953/g.84190 Transcript_41953/m.84190 type:complete len:120 (+) Transcript_41953:337-696(+)